MKERKKRKKQAKKERREDRKNFMKMEIFARSMDPNGGILLNMDVHLCFVFLRSRILISARRSTILAIFFFSFPQSLQENDGIIPKIWPRSVTSILFPIRHSQIILTLCTI
jgi:hypothetical protein